MGLTRRLFLLALGIGLTERLFLLATGLGLTDRLFLLVLGIGLTENIRFPVKEVTSTGSRPLDRERSNAKVSSILLF